MIIKLAARLRWKIVDFGLKTFTIKHSLDVIKPTLVTKLLIILLNLSIDSIVIFFLHFPHLFIPYLSLILLSQHLPPTYGIKPRFLLISLYYLTFLANKIVSFLLVSVLNRSHMASPLYWGLQIVLQYFMENVFTNWCYFLVCVLAESWLVSWDFRVHANETR